MKFLQPCFKVQRELFGRFQAQGKFGRRLDLSLPPIKTGNRACDLRTGNKFGAVDLMKLGARDYLVKDINFLPLLSSVVETMTIEFMIT